ncbi:MAG: hypothetical protein NTZ97_02640 [Candidatus Moranbacteria bacterium]|nr:hypothetical protein [Candidatus Moranbacteria bacterium]
MHQLEGIFMQKITDVVLWLRTNPEQILCGILVAVIFLFVAWFLAGICNGHITFDD